jgi:hypothetical protein
VQNPPRKGLETLSRFFHQCGLRPNPSKTEVCVFHLGTHDANRKLTVQFDNDPLITHVDHPKYLGMTLTERVCINYIWINWDEGELSCQLSSNIVRMLCYVMCSFICFREQCSMGNCTYMYFYIFVHS